MTACILDAANVSISENVKKERKQRNNNTSYKANVKTFVFCIIRRERRGATCDKQLPFVIHQNAHTPYRSAVRRTYLPYTKGICPSWVCVRERLAYGAKSLECSSYIRHTSYLPISWAVRVLVADWASCKLPYYNPTSILRPYSAKSKASQMASVTRSLGNNCCALAFSLFFQAVFDMASVDLPS